MTSLDANMAALAVITLAAAIVNGGLGYGFSSLTVPLALFFFPNRVLNPALVVIEVALNGYVVFVNRDAVPRIWGRMLPVLVALGPGVALGTACLSFLNAEWLKVVTYVTLLPLVLLQLAGFRRPIRRERTAGAAFGAGLGLLYSTTTISGPPLALALSNQELDQQAFRAALGCVRLAESSLTAVAYGYAGLYSHESTRLIAGVLPSLAIGVPIGVYVVRHVRPEAFRRACLSVNAWIIGAGLATMLYRLNLVGTAAAWLLIVAVIGVDAWLLWRARTDAGVRAAADCPR